MVCLHIFQIENLTAALLRELPESRNLLPHPQ